MATNLKNSTIHNSLRILRENLIDIRETISKKSIPLWEDLIKSLISETYERFYLAFYETNPIIKFKYIKELYIKEKIVETEIETIRCLENNSQFPLPIYAKIISSSARIQEDTKKWLEQTKRSVLSANPDINPEDLAIGLD